MGKNLELKAHLSSFDETRRRVESLKEVHFEAEDKQTDTFYNVNRGRLKLRESEFYGSLLIPYLREDTGNAKESAYSLLAVNDVQNLKEIFAKMFGVRIVVEKKRIIYLYENVRIHLDQVKNLGDFLEFEAVLGPEYDMEDGRQKIAFLKKYLHIKDEDLISVAYADMLTAKSGKSG